MQTDTMKTSEFLQVVQGAAALADGVLVRSLSSTSQMYGMITQEY